MSNTAIHCMVDIFVKPESLEKVRDILLTLVEPSLKENGCLYYKLFENIHDQYQFTFIQTWANENAFEDHLQSAHVQKASFTIYEGLAKAPDIKRYKSLQIESNTIKIQSTINSRFCILL
jgi:quinol monooxygenase YgiN